MAYRLLTALFLAVFSLAISAGHVFAGNPQDSVPTISLEKAHGLALQNNYNIKNIGETIYQADVMIHKAWAILLPNLTADGSITRNNASSEIDMSDPTAPAGQQQPEPIVIQELWNKKFGFTANMTIFNARSIPLLQKAYKNVDYANYSGRQTKNDLLLAVSSAYYQVWSTKETVSVAKETLLNAREFLKMSEAKKTVGQATKIDVLRAESEVMNAEKSLSNAKDSLRLAKTALSYLIGIEGEFGIKKPEEPTPAPGTMDEIANFALSERMDLKAAKVSLLMSEKDSTEVWTKWIPSFDVTYNWEWNSASGFAGENDSWRLIFGAKWSILEGGYKIADLYDKKSAVRQARNRLEQMKLDVREEVESNALQVGQKRRNVEFASKQVALAEETHRLVSRQYELGMATSLDVLDSSTQLTQARIGQVLEELQYGLAVLSLNRAAGHYNKALGPGPGTASMF